MSACSHQIPTHVVHREVWPHAVCIHTEKCIMFKFIYSMTNSMFVKVLGVFSYIALYLKMELLNLMLGARCASFTLRGVPPTNSACWSLGFSCCLFVVVISHASHFKMSH